MALPSGARDHGTGQREVSEDDDLRALIETLGREVYGADFERFLATPRRTLGWDTPAARVERGDLQAVVEILLNAVEGHFT
jgi:hypothetical protein